MYDEVPETPYEQAKMLESIMLAACEGDRRNTGLYQHIRSLLIQDPLLRPLLPEDVRTARDLNHFWSRIKTVSPHWEPRRKHVRDSFTPLFDHFEGASRAPVDPVVSDALASFDTEGVHSVWNKALARRHSDPDGAITSARTLLETVCKRILDECSVDYQEKDDLPKLYSAVAAQLKIAPSQHTEETFKRILGGCSSVVEGLGTLRNKVGDAHGKGGRPVRPTGRHAQLAVNLAGTTATFLVETWQARSE